jgi:parallel beta-helix repeat protein
MVMRALAFLAGLLFCTQVFAQAGAPGLGSIGRSGLAPSKVVGPPPTATTYYVSTSGLDTNDGLSTSTPWQTIGKVNGRTYAPGTTILFNGGQTFSGGLNFTASSWSGATLATPITVGSYGTGNATISSGTASGLTVTNNAGFVAQDLIFVGAGATSHIDGIFINNSQAGNTKLSGIKLQRLDVSAYGSSGVLVKGSAGTSGFSNVTISYVVSHGNTFWYAGGLGSAGINVSSPSSGWTFGSSTPSHTNVTIDHCTVYGNNGISSSTNWTGSGIYVAETGTGTISNNLAYNNGTSGPSSVAIWAEDSSNITVQDNEAYGQGTFNNLFGTGFVLSGGIINSVVQYNYSHDNFGPGFMVAAYSNGSPPLAESDSDIVRFNVSQDDVTSSAPNTPASFVIYNDGTAGDGGISNLQVYNNTIYQSHAGMAILATGGATPSDISGFLSNNIYYTTGTNPFAINYSTGAATPLTWVGNNYYNTTGAFSLTNGATTYTSLASFQAAGYEKVGSTPVGTTANPQLTTPGGGLTTNTTPGDPSTQALAYKLLAGSPMLGAGQTIASPGSQDFFNNTLPGSNSIGADQSSPVSVANMITPLLGSTLPITSGTATEYTTGQPALGQNTTTTTSTRKVPIPIAGTLSGLAAGMNAPFTTAAIFSYHNGAQGTLTCNFSASQFCNSGSATEHYAQGDLLNWQWVPGGTWAQTSGLPMLVSALFQADSGSSTGMILSGSQTSGTNGATVHVYQGFGFTIANNTQATDLLASTLMPAAGTISGLYVLPNASESATNPHTYTLIKNGTATGISCTANTTTVTAGCCTNAGGVGNIGGVTAAACTAATAVSIAVGDTISLDIGCPSAACNSVSPGASVQWNPTTPGQAILAVSGAGNLNVASTTYTLGLSDNTSFSNTETNWQLVPKVASTMTLSKTMFCTVGNPGTTPVRTVNVRYATTQVAPTTNSPVTLSVGTGQACPGANSGVLLGGNQDTTHLISLNAGSTVDYSQSFTGAPANATNYKFSSVATVP